MRDLDALLGSLVNIDRNSLIALLSSEFEAAKRVAQSVRHRTAFQRAKRQERRSEPLISTGFCRSYGTKKFRRRCLKVMLQFAYLLSKSCVREANRNQIFVLL